jgi:hypothetical protein
MSDTVNLPTPLPILLSASAMMGDNVGRRIPVQVSIIKEGECGVNYNFILITLLRKT